MDPPAGAGGFLFEHWEREECGFVPAFELEECHHVEVGHFGGDGSGGFEFREAVFVESEFEVSECAGEGHDGGAT